MTLLTVCHRPEPLAVRAAAALATGAFDQESIVARVVEMSDEVAVREHLRERLRDDAEYRLLARKLSAARHLELRALAAATSEAAQISLAEGMRSMLDAGERIRFVSGLRALQGEQSRGALLQVDPRRSQSRGARRGPGSRSAACSTRTSCSTWRAARWATRACWCAARRSGSSPGSPRSAGCRACCGPCAPTTIPRSSPSVAELAEASFPGFVDLALGLPLDGEEALLVARVARYVHHPELARLLPALARSGSPDVRRAIAALFRHRPDAADDVVLEALVLDPVVAGAQGGRRRGRRRGAVGPARAHGGRSRSGRAPRGRAGPGRRVGPGPRCPRDARPPGRRPRDDRARRGLRGRGCCRAGRCPSRPGSTRAPRPRAVAEAAHLPALRETARTAPAEERRLAAALALALLRGRRRAPGGPDRPGALDPPPGERRARARGRAREADEETPPSRPSSSWRWSRSPCSCSTSCSTIPTRSSLVVLSARQVRRRVAGHFVEDLDLIDQGDLTKPLTMIVPAFNEEVTIVDSVTNLVQCDYPRHEVVVVNDGSGRPDPRAAEARRSVSAGPIIPYRGRDRHRAGARHVRGHDPAAAGRHAAWW